jgi:hypothetical protein
LDSLYKHIGSRVQWFLTYLFVFVG